MPKKSERRYLKQINNIKVYRLPDGGGQCVAPNGTIILEEPTPNPTIEQAIRRATNTTCFLQNKKWYYILYDGESLCRQPTKYLATAEEQSLYTTCDHNVRREGERAVAKMRRLDQNRGHVIELVEGDCPHKG